MSGSHEGENATLWGKLLDSLLEPYCSSLVERRLVWKKMLQSLEWMMMENAQLSIKAEMEGNLTSLNSQFLLVRLCLVPLFVKI
jgi:hypothetical protein